MTQLNKLENQQNEPKVGRWKEINKLDTQKLI